MNKNLKYYVIIWSICLALFNAVTFIIPNKIMGVTRFTSGLFWIGYAFITVAFIGQLIIGILFFKADSKDKAFLKFPLLNIGYTALSVSLVVGITVSAIPVIPTWIGAIISLIFTAYFAVGAVKASAVYENVYEIENGLERKTSFIKSMTVESKALMGYAKTEEVKEAVKKVYEAFRFSDPISSLELDAIEEEIFNKFDNLTTAVKEDDDLPAIDVAEELIILIKDRNTKCRALKK